MSQLVEVELFSALSRRVRMGEISQGDARTISAHFQSDLDDGFYHYLTVETVHYKLARDWISRFDIAILFELCLKSLIKREHRNSPPKPPVHGGLGGEGSGVILLAVSYQY